MTEEEYFRENYPDSCYGDRPLSPHWDFFQDGVEFGERQSEKQIQIDVEHIRALQKQNGELADKVKELEAQIEKMKNCKNCKKLKKEKDGLLVCTVGSFYANRFGENCDKWEIKEK